MLLKAKNKQKKNKKNPKNTTLTIPKSNITVVERGKIDIPNTHIHDPYHTNAWPLTHKYMTANTQIHERLFSWIGTYTGTSINSEQIKLVLWAQTSPLSEMVPSCKCFSNMSKIPSLTYNRANSIIIKNAIILKIINLLDTDVVICII